jgi:hypothetical protein
MSVRVHVRCIPSYRVHFCRGMWQDTGLMTRMYVAKVGLYTLAARPSGGATGAYTAEADRKGARALLS